MILAILTSAQVGFYATAATVIPVLLLAYLLQLSTVAEAVSLKHVAAEVRKLTAEGASRLPRRTVARLYLWAPAQTLIMVAWFLPVACEIACFRVLMEDRTFRGASGLVMGGLAVAVVGAVAPLSVRIYRLRNAEDADLEAALEAFRDKDDTSLDEARYARVSPTADCATCGFSRGHTSQVVIPSPMNVPSSAPLRPPANGFAPAIIPTG